MTTYRVWVHGTCGDDECYTFKSLSKAVEFSRKTKYAETPLLAKGRSLLTSREYAVPHHKILKSLGRKKRTRQIDEFERMAQRNMLFGQGERKPKRKPRNPFDIDFGF